MKNSTPSKRKRYFGKYRGVVVSNVDPELRGRITAEVPGVSALLPTTWALPCMPVASLQAGCYMVPPPLAGVWIEFEAGDPNYPIWSGCYWGSAAEVPVAANLGTPESPNIVMQTTAQNMLMLSDVPGPTGGITLRTTAGATLMVSDTGIVMQNGQGASFSMIGSTITIGTAAGGIITVAGNTVSINPPALVVT